MRREVTTELIPTVDVVIYSKRYPNWLRGWKGWGAKFGSDFSTGF